MKELIVANWKMYLTLRQSTALAKGISKSQILRPRRTRLGRANPKLDVVLCPSFVALEEVAKVVKGTRVKLGAQDVDPEGRGSHTGAVGTLSVPITPLSGVGLDDLGEIGVQYVLVGHSERRAKGEDDVLINRKLKAVLKAGMRPILCVGEPSRTPTTPLPPPLTLLPPKADRQAGGEKFSGRRGNLHGQVVAQRYVAKQLRAGLKGVAEKDLRRVIIAYEPIWAIGTGNPATPEMAATMHAQIRKNMAIKTTPILYGGSVDSKNAAAFLQTRGVDGLLIGRASTVASEFIRILKGV